MSSVDNRVINLEFNNKGFEKGVAQTLKSIENLKKGLNFKDSSRSIQDLEKSVKNLNTSNLVKAVNNLKGIEKNVNLNNTTKSIDELQSKNKVFSLSNIQNAVKKLSDITGKLNFRGTNKDIDDLKSKTDSFDMGSLINAVETVSNRFSTLGVIGMTVLQNITNAALNAGKTMISALSIQPITDGFREYETQMGAIQTILANTQAKGSNLNDVNNALNTLNTYADKTIYNFTEMTRNIGTFTAAGVDLQTSVDSIQGIANLAAVSGSTSQQASTAMYQLSQAIATGTVKLMDWNSVVNAGMGGQVFQDALIRTSEHLKTGAKAAIAAKGSFRESLSEGWLTTQVLTETLRQFSLNVDTAKDYERAVQSLVDQGYTKEEATNIANMAKTAADAATKVKTFSQLIDTLKEALGSGWTNSWQIILGDFEEAKDLFTNISNALSKIVNESANARNAMLTSGLSTGWKQLLAEGISDEQKFMETTKQVAREHGVSVDEMINKNGSFAKSLKEGWADSSILSESISKMADEIRGLGYEELKAKGYTEDQAASLIALDDGIKNGSIDIDEYAKKMTKLSGREHLINALSNAFKGLSDIVGKVKESFEDVFPPMTGEKLYSITESIDKFSKNLIPSEKTLDKIGRTAKGVFAIFDLGKQSVMAIANGFKQFGSSTGFSVFTSSLLDITAAIGDFLVEIDDAAKKSDVFTAVSQGVVKVLSVLSSGWKGFSDTVLTAKNILTNVLNVIKTLASSLSGGLKEGFTWLKDNVTLDDIFEGLKAGSMLGMAANLVTLSDKFGEFVDTIKGFVKQSKDVFGLKQIASNISEFFKTIGTALTDFTGTVKFGKLLIIAASVAMLVDSMKKLSELNQDQLTQGLVSIGILLAELNLAVGRVAKSLSGTDTASIIKASASMVLMAMAIKKLAKAMVIIAGIDIEGIAKGLISVRVLMSGLAKFTQKANMSEGSLKTAAVLIAMAEAIKILSGVMKTVGDMDVESIAKGIAGITACMADLVLASRLLNKIKVKAKTSVALLSLATSMKIIASAMVPIGKMKLENIAKSVGAITILLGELTGVTVLLDKFAGHKRSIRGAAAILIIAQAIKSIVPALTDIGALSWGEIGRGLTGIGIALAELSVALIAVDKFTGFTGGIAGAAAILIVAQALEPIGEALNKVAYLSWEEIGKGLTAMGVALAELVAAVSIAGLSGLSGVVGAIGIDLVAPQLDTIANALQKFGSMSWSEIGAGLTAMGGALAELVIACGVEGLTGLSGVLGALSLDTLIPQLDSLANALQKFGSMSWDEINKGLVAMAGALGDAALGGLVNTLSGFGAGAISTIAEPLGTLADSVKKWSDVTVPSDLSSQLAGLASGVMKFTLGGFGAGTISTVAKPIGTLASSVKKWEGVTVPDGIGDQLGKLADGVGKFAFVMGAGALAESAKPLGDMASSVKKWKDVTVPDNMEDGLGQLARGVNQFVLSGISAGSISALNDPLKNLAKSVKAWKNVELSQDLGTMLETLGNGVNSFLVSGISAASISALNDPLKNMASSVQAWSGVTVPENLGSQMTSLSNGLNSFDGVSGSIESFSSAAKSLSKMATGVSTLSTVDLDGVAAKISNFSTALKNIPTDLTGVAEGVATNLNSIAAAITSNSVILSVAVTGLMNSAVDAINNSSELFTTAGNTVSEKFGSAFESGLKNQNEGVSSEAKSVVSSAAKAASSEGSSKKQKFTDVGSNFDKSLKSGITDGKSGPVAAVKAVIDGCVTKAQDTSQVYYAGMNFSYGLANGIRDGGSAAINAATDVASAALKAAKKALGEKSPSRITHQFGLFFDQGLINGIIALKKKVGMTAASVGDIAVAKMQDSMSGATATLTPVIDSNNVLASMSNKRFKVDTRFVGSITNPMSNMQSAIEQSNLETMKSNTRVLNAINELNDNLGSYTDAVANTETAMYVDGKKLASSIAKPMNQQLGVLSRRGGLA